MFLNKVLCECICFNAVYSNTWLQTMTYSFFSFLFVGDGLCVVSGYTGPSWCALQKKLASEREAGIGYEPECVEDGKMFKLQQCDEVYCWCVSETGREIPSTRSPRLVKTSSCDSTQFPLLFLAHLL